MFGTPPARGGRRPIFLKVKRYDRSEDLINQYAQKQNGDGPSSEGEKAPRSWGGWRKKAAHRTEGMAGPTNRGAVHSKLLGR